MLLIVKKCSAFRTIRRRTGGVFPRSAKSIPISKEAQEALGIAADALTPNELIHAMLRAPVDLLWNGGIGTYAKAAEERHSSVGDRSNDVPEATSRAANKVVAPWAKEHPVAPRTASGIRAEPLLHGLSLSLLHTRGRRETERQRGPG